MKKKILCILFTFLLLFTLSSCTSYPEETRMAKEYLGMTFGEVKALWGNDCILGGDLYETAQKGIFYEDGRTPYIFLFNTEITDIASLPDDAVVTLVRAPYGKGRPCENSSFPNAATPSILNNLTSYHFGSTGPDDPYGSTIFYLKQESIALNYRYSQDIAYIESPVTAYEVSEIPLDRQYEQYYWETDDREKSFFFTYGDWPPENWDHETEAPFNFIIYRNEFDEWSDPDAVAELIETGKWPEDAYIPYPYDKIENIDFRNQFDEWPPENWDYIPIDECTVAYYSDFHVWPDPDAYDEFRKTGHWPEDAYVPLPYGDIEALYYLWTNGEWPEGTDLSQIPDKKWWEE